MSRIHPRLQSLEARDVPNGTQLFAVAEEGSMGRVAVYRADGEDAQSTGVPGAPVHIIQRGTLLTTFNPFPGFGGGVRVAVGDVTGDGYDDIICGAGLGGGPHIKVYEGHILSIGIANVYDEFFAFNADFHGGVFVAVGQVNPATRENEIIVGAGESGGPHVRIFALDTVLGIIDFETGIVTPTNHQRLQNEFFAFDGGFRGGVRVAAGDTNGDGRAEVVTAAGPSGGPHVRVFDVPEVTILSLPPYGHAVIDEFFAYDASFRGGVYVAAGNVAGSSQFAEVATGAGEGGGPHLKVYSREATGRLQTITERFVGSTALLSGVRVGMADLSNGIAGSLSIYVGRGYDPLVITLPEVEQRLAGFSFHSGSFAEMTLDLERAFMGQSDGVLNVGE